MGEHTTGKRNWKAEEYLVQVTSDQLILLKPRSAPALARYSKDGRTKDGALELDLFDLKIRRGQSTCPCARHQLLLDLSLAYVPALDSNAT
eukprot:scaffold7344_cov145-Cylindrotheca_fusiformis.AAC.5